MYYMYQPNQNYFNGEIPTYKPQSRQQQDLLVNPYQNNITNFGGTGYNNSMGNMGGYYNGGYYNPYLYKEQQRLYEQQQQDRYNNDFIMMKNMLRMSYGAYNIPITEEELDIEVKKRFCPQTLESNEMTYQEMEYERLKNMNLEQENAQVICVNANRDLYNQAVAYTNIQNIYEADNLYDWMEKFDKEQERQIRRELELQSRDLSGMYNSTTYNNLLQSHQSISALKSSVDIDDLSVELPAKLKNSYAERRQQFLNAILSKMD